MLLSIKTRRKTSKNLNANRNTRVKVMSHNLEQVIESERLREAQTVAEFLGQGYTEPEKVVQSGLQEE